MREPTETLTVMPLDTVKPDHTQVRREPHLSVGPGRESREVIPRQPVFTLVKPPTLSRPAADPGLHGKPQLPFGIKGYPRHVSDTPGAPAVIFDLNPLPPLAVLHIKAAT